ncbi:Noc2p family-domain-containing protein [Halteromyces radiatus]|uniref:Noc2p family-domain-containing protein n=1 Tax=Halteromyces radiatus TaxID=101107 RepID=UPI0022201567|nr:Noc2p family-domain-containing protein [Halteromyces radiatus]KAI8098797.1 Noc2p family-domain-containing protein [Halteromyces radiatus]
MGKVSKSTVKFQKNKLKQTIERRKKNAKLKQQIKRRQETRLHGHGHKKSSSTETTSIVEQPEEETKESQVIDNVDTYFANYILNGEESLDLENDEEQDVNALDAFEAVQDEEAIEREMELDLANENMESSSDEESDEEMELSDDNENDDDDDDDDAQLITKVMLQSWTRDAAKKSPQAFKNLLLGLRAVAYDDSTSKNTYRINSSKVYTKLVKVTVASAYPIFSQHLIVNKKVRHPAKTRFWTKLERVVRLFLNNVVRFLRDLDQDDMLVDILNELEPCAMYFGCFPNLCREYLRVLLDRWSDFTLASDTRLVCYKAIRTLATNAIDANSKQNFLPHCLKAVYLVYAKKATKVNEHTLVPLQQMMEEATDLYTIDPKLSHEHGHVYIRQLADHLKQAKKSNTVESFKTIYTWQYISCLDFWSNVIAVTCNPEIGTTSPMQALLQPVVDLSLHTLRLNPTSQFLPLRIHIIRSLVALIDSTGFYIPLAPFIFEIFGNEIFKAGVENNESLDDFEWEYHLKVPKVYLNSKVYQNAVYRAVYDNLVDYYACFGLSIAYPELAIPAISKVRSKN